MHALPSKGHNNDSPSNTNHHLLATTVVITATTLTLKALRTKKESASDQANCLG
jgi:hypothetical protein